MKKALPFFGLLCFSTLSCSSWLHKNANSNAPKPPSELAASNNLSPFLNDEQEAVDEDEDEDEEVADLDKSEATPADLGDVQASEKRKEEEVRADELSRKTFPMVYNEFVEQWIHYFTSNRGIPVFSRWLERSTRYIPMMKQVLRDEGLPEDLIYLSMIESGFNPKASSRAKAVGPWQFIKPTGERYGLIVNHWVDERRDYKKSTFAAAKYLKELHLIFGSWYLAAASYNAGEGKVLYAVRRDHSRNFWELARKKKNFRSETRNYVPKIVAAALLSKNPEKYGFSNIDYERPLAWETLHVPSGVDLHQVADLVHMDFEDLQILNSELRRSVTPPESNGYELRIPPDKKEALIASMGKLEIKKLGSFITHIVKRGESLKSIAHRYGVGVSTLVELNEISRKRRLRAGTELSIPVGDHRKASSIAEDDGFAPNANARNVRTISSHKGKNTISPGPTGETAASLPPPSATPSKAALVANSAASGVANIPTSATHAAPAPASAATASSALSSPGKYTLQPGDTLWAIAHKYGVSVDAIRRANNFKKKRDVRAGATITIPQSRSS